MERSVMTQCDNQDMDWFLKFLANAPEDQDIINMDCNDHCEQLAQLAEQVAAGKHVNDLIPKLEEYMHYWTDCREEFEALVAILRAEQEGAFDAADDAD